MIDEIVLRLTEESPQEIYVQLSSRRGDLTEPIPIDVAGLDAFRALSPPYDFSDRIPSISHAVTALALPEDVAAQLQAAYGDARRKEASLRVAIHCASPTLNRVPWETMSIRRNSHLDLLNGPLALDPGIRLVRGHGASEAWSTPERLRVLLVTANPGSARFAPLAWLDSETRAIESMFDRAPTPWVEFQAVHDAVPVVLERKIREFRPHVIHFSGHAELRVSKGGIVLQGATAGSDIFLLADDLAQWLSGGETRLIVFAACDTAGASHAVAETLFRRGIPAVVGMQAPVQDACQPTFARAFYGALLEGAPVDEAMAEARQAIQGAGGAWAIPALFLSGEPTSLIERPSSIRRRTNPTNLPPLDRPLVGRDEERARLVQLLREGRRLVTLTGVGGVGKSSLAIEAARELLAEFPDGVWFLEGDTWTTPEDLFTNILGALRLEPKGLAPADAVGAVLAGKRILFVIDCLEGFASTGGASALARLLTTTPAICLATSRRKLEVSTEIAVSLSPLDSVGRGGEFGPSEHLFCQAAELDLSRLSAGERATIGEICALLEGIPLAILLAAARARIVSLSHLLLLLQSNSLRTIDGPHAKMSLAIQRSLNLIPEADRRLLWKLCVFSGSFTMHDVAAVYSENAVENHWEVYEILDGLTRLMEHSLLQVLQGGSQPRVRLLDTIREYMAATIQDDAQALERLEARRKHAARYAQVAATMGDVSPENAHTLLWSNLGNYRSALSFSLEYRRFEQVSGLAYGLSLPFMEAGLRTDFDTLARAAYIAADALNDPALVARMLGLEGAVAARGGDEARCRELWTKRAALCEQIGDLGGAADACIDVAVQLLEDDVRDDVAGRSFLDRAERFLGPDGSPELRATVAILQAQLELREGREVLAREKSDIAIEIAARLHESNPSLFVELNIGHFWRQLGILWRAERAYLDVAQLARKLERPTLVAASFTRLGAVYEAAGQIHGAWLAHQAAAKLLTTLKSRKAKAALGAQAAFAHRNRTHPAVGRTSTESWEELVSTLFAQAPLTFPD